MYTAARVQMFDHLDYLYSQLRERVADPLFREAGDAQVHELLSEMQIQIELVRRVNEAEAVAAEKAGG